MAQGLISVIGILMRLRAWLLAIPLTFAVLAGVATAIQWVEGRALDVHGVETSATVINRSTGTHSTQRRPDGTRSTYYRVRYEFETPDGETISNSSAVSSGFYDGVQSGDEVTMRFLPDDPQTAELEPGRTREGLMFYGVFAFLFSGVTAVIGWRFWRRCAAMLRAGHQGEKRTATVLAHVGGRMQMEGQPVFEKLHWRDNSGLEGKSLTHRPEMLSWWPKGSEITVHVDPLTNTPYWEGDIFGLREAR